MKTSIRVLSSSSRRLSCNQRAVAINSSIPPTASSESVSDLNARRQIDEYLQQRSVDIISKPFPEPDKPIVWNYAAGMLRVLVVNRDNAFNALNLEMIKLYMEHLLAFEKSDLVSMVAVVNNKYAKAFCAGGDIKGD